MTYRPNPRSIARTGSALTSYRAPNETPRAPRRILVVDDSHVMRIILSKVLRAAGYQIELAADGRQAIEKTLAFHPHLVLVDLSMPVMDGWEYTRWIRSHPRLSDTIVVALSGNAQRSDVEYALACGATSYLMKPMAHPALVNHVTDLLTRIEQPPAKKSIAECSVLLADEAGLMRRRVSRTMTELGCRVLEAEDYEQAWLYADRYRPDLVLVDLDAPLVEGVALTRRLRQIPEMRRVPVVAVSADRWPEDVERALQAGITDYIVKPFTEERFVQRVVTYLVDGMLDDAPAPAPIPLHRSAAA